MTCEELAKIRERWEASTEGYWRWQNDGMCPDIVSELDGARETITEWVLGDRSLPPNEADLEFITHAHQDVPALLRHIDKLKKALENAYDGWGGIQSKDTCETCIYWHPVHDLVCLPSDEELGKCDWFSKVEPGSKYRPTFSVIFSGVLSSLEVAIWTHRKFSCSGYEKRSDEKN